MLKREDDGRGRTRTSWWRLATKRDVRRQLDALLPENCLVGRTGGLQH
jgi:hypothetical protein